MARAILLAYMMIGGSWVCEVGYVIDEKSCECGGCECECRCGCVDAGVEQFIPRRGMS